MATKTTKFGKGKRNYGKGKEDPKTSRGGNRNSGADFTGRNIRNDDSEPTSAHSRGGSSCRNGDNDISWYSANPQLLNDVGSLSFGTPNGNQIHLPSSSQSVKAANIGPQPGIMTLSVAPMFGNTKDMNSPINIAARNIYSYVRHVNSGHTNYDITDLMNYIMGMDSLFSYYQRLCRLYGLSSYYAVKNKYTAKALIEADGVVANDIINNLADFRAYINMCANKISSLCVPMGMPFMLRHMWIYSNVYKDSDSEKAQLYMFTPDRFYKYNETEAPFYYQYGGSVTTAPTKHNYTDVLGWMQPTAFRCHDYAGSGRRIQKSLAKLKTEFDELINAMMGSEDVGIISGDILKAFGASGVASLMPITEDYQVLPIYSAEVLDQIHNLVSLDFSIDNHSSGASDYSEDLIAGGYYSFGTMYQDSEGSELAPVLINETRLAKFDNNTGASEAYDLRPWSSYILDLPYDHCTPSDVMIATRLMPCMSVSRQQGNPFYHDDTSYWDMLDVTSCGADVIMSIEIHYYWNYAGWLDSLTHWTYFQNRPNKSQSLEELGKWTKFNRAPQIYVATTITDTQEELVYQPLFTVGDFENYTVVTKDVLERLDEVALISMFDCPTAASYKYVH